MSGVESGFGAVEACGRDVGTRPFWMSDWQYKPCPCDLPKGHQGDCSCEHTRSAR